MALVIIYCQNIQNFMTKQIEVFERLQLSYYCTYSTIEIELYSKLNRGQKVIEYCIFLIMLQFLLIIFSVFHVTSHYRVNISWLQENPIDGLYFARAIQVGIPPEIDH